MTSQKPVEPVIEPELPIVDAHHHLWFLPEAALAATEKQETIAAHALAPIFRRHGRYLFDEFMTDLRSGHNISASVFVECHAMYRAGGPEATKSLGEIEFANGVAAMAASGLFGEMKVCAGIVGGVDLRMGDAVEEVLRAHLQVAGARYRGVRGAGIAYDEDERILGANIGMPRVLLDRDFRKGFKWLQPLGLSFDVFMLEPQIPDLIDLACAFPDTQIILNHVGAPLGVGRYAGQREERFPIWRDHIRKLSQCPKVTVKLGGLGTPFVGFEYDKGAQPATSVELAELWRPYIETCIEYFGADRCMFESNFPVDSAAGTYAVLWNSFKRLAAGGSKYEKIALFSGTATRVYRLDI